MNGKTKLIIDLDQLHSNIKEILSYKKGTFMFVLKANAYGMGYLEILNELQRYDSIAFIGVALPEEAMYIRNHTTKKIVVLGYTFDEDLVTLVDHNIIPSIFELHQAKLLPKKSEVFINVDTGFHRLGCNKEEFEQLVDCENITIQGVFTHLRLTNQKSDMDQVSMFNEIVQDRDFPYISISDSIAYTRYHLNENLYRIGAAMFGYTSTSEIGILNLRGVAQLETTVTRVEKIKQDTDAFYRSHLTKGQVIATIQIGYGDGLFRNMPQHSTVSINGQRCNYIEVGMDQSIIDVTDKHVSVGDSVVLFGKDGSSLEELAKALHTNKNNILTMIQKRVVREYVTNKKIRKRIGLQEDSYENN